MKIKSSQLAIGLVCILLGFVITMQIKSVSFNTNRETAIKSGNTRLEEASSLKAENEELKKKIIMLEEEIDFYNQNLGATGDGRVMLEQIKRAETLAGLTSLTGEGVVVTMNDSKAKGADGVSSENYLIHDDDVRKVVNELFAAGAEAISINGERMIVTSAIRCVGPVIVINNNRYSPPYVISAIGDRKTLSAALNQRDGVVDTLRNLWKIEIDIVEKEKVVIPRYTGTTTFKYAKKTAE